MTNHSHFVRDFIFDEEQIETLQKTYRERFPHLRLAGTYNRKTGTGHHGTVRRCDHVAVKHKELPDISLEILSLLKELSPDIPEDMWFAQFEFIRYEGVGQQFLRHSDDTPTGENHNRFFTSVTVLEKSDDLVGGNLRIWTPDGNDYVVDLQPFETIIFPAYYHHEATTLVSGRRVVLVSWAQRGR